MMNYKGYRAAVAYDDEAGIFHGEVIGTRDVITFEGTSVEQLREEFRFSIDDYLAVCAKIGKRPQQPYSGRLMFRVSSDVHRKVALAAKRSGKSLDQWAEEVLDHAVQ